MRVGQKSDWGGTPGCLHQKTPFFWSRDRQIRHFLKRIASYHDQVYFNYPWNSQLGDVQTALPTDMLVVVSSRGKCVVGEPDWPCLESRRVATGASAEGTWK